MYDKLLKWKYKSNKKAMCIFGALQIGKTTVVREFGKNEYENFVEINFLEDADAAKIFEGSLNIDTLITNLTAYTIKSMKKGKT